MNGSSALERVLEKLNQRFSAYWLPFFTCFAVGLTAYGFAFTNKLLNLDEISGLFKKGESLSSGRWALWLSSYLFPDASMPWINGILSLFMLTVSILLVIALFEIKSKPVQVLLAGLMVAFPSQIITFSYMFTCAPYALALLLAVSSVYVFCKGGRGRWAVSALLLAFSLGIYQAYLSYAAALYLVYMIRNVLNQAMDDRKLWHQGLLCVCALTAALAAYGIINQAVMLLSGTQYNSYADASMQKNVGDILFGLRVAYTAFVGYFIKGYYHLAATPFSQGLHILCAGIIGYVLLHFLLRKAHKGQAVLLLFCLSLLPLAVNCLYVVSSLRHSLMLYSFTAVYVLAAVCLETLFASHRYWLRDLLMLAMALIVACNLVYANRLYLKMKLEYENAYSFYQGLVTRIKMAEGFDRDTMVVIAGDAHELLAQADEIETSDLVGIMEGLINVYSRNDFLTYYIGFTPKPVNWDKWEESGGDAILKEMPIYPYDGSIQKVGDYLLVKLG